MSFFGGEWLDEDGVTTMECNHKVLVSTPGLQVEASGVIHEQVGKENVNQGNFRGHLRWVRGISTRVISGGICAERGVSSLARGMRGW